MIFTSFAASPKPSVIAWRRDKAWSSTQNGDDGLGAEFCVSRAWPVWCKMRAPQYNQAIVTQRRVLSKDLLMWVDSWGHGGDPLSSGARRCVQFSVFAGRWTGIDPAGRRRGVRGILYCKNKRLKTREKQKKGKVCSGTFVNSCFFYVGSGSRIKKKVSFQLQLWQISIVFVFFNFC